MMYSVLAATSDKIAAVPLAETYPLLGQVTEGVMIVLLLVGAIFGVVGNYGLIRLPDPMTRLHAPTKAATLGVGAMLIVSMLNAAIIKGDPSWHELLIAVFLFLTAPVTGHFIAKANMHRSWPADRIVRPSPESQWATYGDSANKSLMDDGADSRLDKEH